MPLVTISQSLDESFRKHKIVPDVIPAIKSEVLLSIAYDKNRQVGLGNELNVSETQAEPKILIVPNASGHGPKDAITETDKFIFVLTDPDAPSNTDHKWSEYAHWLVTGLLIKKSQECPEGGFELDFDSANTLLDYVGPAPPPGTGKHRYVFLLFKQDPGLSSDLKAPSDRPTWGTGVPGSGVSNWIKANTKGLQLLGVNFFYAQLEKQRD